MLKGLSRPTRAKFVTVPWLLMVTWCNVTNQGYRGRQGWILVLFSPPTVSSRTNAISIKCFSARSITWLPLFNSHYGATLPSEGVSHFYNGFLIEMAVFVEGVKTLRTFHFTQNYTYRIPVQFRVQNKKLKILVWINAAVSQTSKKSLSIRLQRFGWSQYHCQAAHVINVNNGNSHRNVTCHERHPSGQIRNYTRRLG